MEIAIAIAMILKYASHLMEFDLIQKTRFNREKMRACQGVFPIRQSFGSLASHT